MISEKKRVDGF